MCQFLDPQENFGREDGPLEMDLGLASILHNQRNFPFHHHLRYLLAKYWSQIALAVGFESIDDRDEN